MVQPEKPPASTESYELGRLLARARKLRDLTQREVGKRVGRPQSYLGKIETGRRDVTVPEFLQLTRAIGVDPRKVFSRFMKELAKKEEASSTSNTQTNEQ